MAHPRRSACGAGRHAGVFVVPPHACTRTAACPTVSPTTGSASASRQLAANVCLLLAPAPLNSLKISQLSEDFSTPAPPDFNLSKILEDSTHSTSMAAMNPVSLGKLSVLSETTGACLLLSTALPCGHAMSPESAWVHRGGQPVLPTDCTNASHLLMVSPYPYSPFHLPTHPNAIAPCRSAGWLPRSCGAGAPPRRQVSGWSAGHSMIGLQVQLGGGLVTG